MTHGYQPYGNKNLKPETEYIIVVETLKHSLLKDTFTFIMIFAVIATGKWIDSTAMQWIGAFMLFFGALARVKGYPRYTAESAVEMLIKKHGAPFSKLEGDTEDAIRQ